MILIRILQKIFHLIGSLCFGTNQSCIKRNCLKDVNIVKRQWKNDLHKNILNPKLKIIKILQKINYTNSTEKRKYYQQQQQQQQQGMFQNVKRSHHMTLSIQLYIKK